jgi:Cu(I)/Ag(I) efflux system membrane fusion protein
MKIRYLILAVLCVTGSFTVLNAAPTYAQHTAHGTADSYYCPMHPTYISDKPGDCPICNMKLVQRRQDDSDIAVKFGGSEFTVSPDKQQLIGVKVDTAAFRPMVKMITSAGTVAFDPELYAAQQEYIEALRARERVRNSVDEILIARAGALVDAGALKLRLLGLDEASIEELDISRTNDASLLLPSGNAQGAWVYAPLYEYDWNWVQPGAEARISVASAAGREFSGTVVSVDPVLDAMTRSARARIRVDDAAGLLKPQMYATVRILVDIGRRLTVPKEAVMETGKRAIVFLALEEGRFNQVEVTVGVSSGDFVEVLSGLKEGDRVAVSGNFLLDSESRLQSALQSTGHEHGQ